MGMKETVERGNEEDNLKGTCINWHNIDKEAQVKTFDCILPDYQFISEQRKLCRDKNEKLDSLVEVTLETEYPSKHGVKQYSQGGHHDLRIIIASLHRWVQ